MNLAAFSGSTRTGLRRRSATVALALLIGLSACTESSEVPGGGPVDEPVPAESVVPHSEAPSADASTAPPSGAVTEAALPTGAELAWLEFGDWTVADTHAGSGNAQLSKCQVNKFESTGANAIVVRTFTAPDGSQAVAAAMSFDSPELTDQAAQTLAGWVDSCEEMLGSGGMSQIKRTFTHEQVRVDGGSAEASEIGWDDQGTGTFESIGITSTDTRVEWVTMTVTGQDSKWDTTPDGPVGQLHPMIRSLPEVTKKLAG